MNLRFYVDPEIGSPHIHGHGVEEHEVEDALMKNVPRFPDGWNEERVQRLLQHYESQTEEEAVAEDEAVLEDTTQTVMEIPNALVPSVRALLSQHAE